MRGSDERSELYRWFVGLVVDEPVWLGSARLGSARLGSARLGSGNMRIMALFLEARMSHRGDSMRLGGGLSRAAPFDCNSA